MKVKERPIIFNAQMVQAILTGFKTQTRRVIKPQPQLTRPWKNWVVDGEVMDLPTAFCPYGISRDRLWVRETWAPMQDINACHLDNEPVDIVYRADDGWDEPDAREMLMEGHWRPSIHMPEWASRILLEVIGVQIERVQEIMEKGAQAEGVNPLGQYWPDPHRAAFEILWNSINEKHGFGWLANPWVWVVKFKVIQR